MGLPLSFRIQGLLLGAALGELFSTGHIAREGSICCPSKESVVLPLTTDLIQALLDGFRIPALSWTTFTESSQSWQDLSLKAIVFPLLYPGSPTQLLEEIQSERPKTGQSGAESIQLLSYAVALALHTPREFSAQLSSQLERPLSTVSAHPHPMASNACIPTVLHSILQTPTDYQFSLQRSPSPISDPSLTPLILTLSGAVSGSLNGILGFPLPWLTRLSAQPCPHRDEQQTWLETLQSLSNRCVARWSGKVQTPGRESDWHRVAVALAHQFRPRY
jgi:hypothetical protein